MKYRQAVIYAQEDATTAKTETIDIDLADIISRIQIKYNALNNGVTPTAHHAAQISKVEIVDGSDVLYSLSAREIEALMFYNTGKGRAYMLENRNDNNNRMVLDLMFGRKLYDKELAFDPTKFRNPQLKITHNKISGGNSPDAATLEVFADVFDEKVITPIGFIMAKEVHSYTTPASAANKYIDLPNDYPIKRIMPQTFKAAYWVTSLLSEIEVNEEESKRKPYDLDGDDLSQLILTKYGAYRETFIGQGLGDPMTYYVTPSDEIAIGTTSISGNQHVYIMDDTRGCQVNLAVTGSISFRAMLEGYFPHGALPLDFGDQFDLTDWFEVQEKGKVKLRYKAAGEVALNTVLEQLRTY